MILSYNLNILNVFHIYNIIYKFDENFKAGIPTKNKT